MRLVRAGPGGEAGRAGAGDDTGAQEDHMTPIFQTSTELIAALRATVESYDRCGGRVEPGFLAQHLGACIAAMKQAADMLELRSTPLPDTMAVFDSGDGGWDVQAVLPNHRHFFATVDKDGYIEDACTVQQGTMKRRPLVDLRPQYPEVAATVARACAAWPGDYSSIAVALMDGHTNMQPNAADAIASLILLFQNVTKSPFNLSAVLQEREVEARAWRMQQGDPPQWSQG
jgi:hypothetical protein